MDRGGEEEEIDEGGLWRVDSKSQALRREVHELLSLIGITSTGC